MPGLASPGLGSGLDITSLVGQLVAAERAPGELRIRRLTNQADSKISALGALNGVLSTLQSSLNGLKTIDAFQVRKAESADRTVFTATANSSAANGTYNREVEQLATAQRLNSGAFAAGSGAVVGTGTLTLTSGTNAFSVDINETNNTLAGIRDAINASSSNTSVQASVIQAADGARLVLAARNVGAANSIRVTREGGDGGLDQLVYDPGVTTNLQELAPAQDARVVIDGFTVNSTTNVIENAIDGVSISLLRAVDDSAFALTVSDDRTTVVENINKFVTEYNNVATKIQELRRFDPSTETVGPLLGDAMLRGIESNLRRELTSRTVSAVPPYDSLAAIGITTGADGKLKVDSARLNAALDSDFSSAARLFGAEDGVGARLARVVDSALASEGALATRTAGLQATKKSLAADQTALDARMELVKARYTRQFIAMDQLLTSLQSTASYLTSQLAKSVS
ncbi:MAG: flagellar filament capping protein FliD [Steroidobacteraceae bacterium]